MNYPVTVSVDTPERIANWRPLVQWLLAIPHLVILNVLQAVALVVGIVAWFAILFTGRLPAGLATFMVMRLRYELRAYAYVGFLTDQYPPFAFDVVSDDPGGYPASISVSPALEGRNRLTAFFRIILMIPAFIYVVVIGIIATICSILGFLAVLFTGRWPGGLRSFVVSNLRVSNRFNAYVGYLTDQYPPFSLN